MMTDNRRAVRGIFGVLLAATMLLSLPQGAAFSQDVATNDTGMFETAKASGRLEDYVAYLLAFPDGAFIDAVKFELQWGFKPEDVTAAMTAAEKTGVAPQTDVTFSTPLNSGRPGVAGFSIEDLIKGTPQFPPFEGIPEELWKGQHCTNCHNWTREALCDQGATYSGPAAAQALEKPHPYGLEFKLALRAFAEGGCR